jgi:hypothetical protein
MHAPPPPPFHCACPWTIEQSAISGGDPPASRRWGGLVGLPCLFYWLLSFWRHLHWCCPSISAPRLVIGARLLWPWSHYYSLIRLLLHIFKSAPHGLLQVFWHGLTAMTRGSPAPASPETGRIPVGTKVRFPPLLFARVISMSASHGRIGAGLKS